MSRTWRCQEGSAALTALSLQFTIIRLAGCELRFRVWGCESRGSEFFFFLGVGGGGGHHEHARARILGHVSYGLNSSKGSILGIICGPL